MPLFILAVLVITGIFLILYFGIALLSCWIFQRKTSENADMHGFISAAIPFLIAMAIGIIVDNPFSNSSPETDGDFFFTLLIPSVLCLLPSPLICVFSARTSLKSIVAKRNKEDRHFGLSHR